MYRIKTCIFDYCSPFPDSPLYKNEVNFSKTVAMRDVANLCQMPKKPVWANMSSVTTEYRVRAILDEVGNSWDIRSIMQKNSLTCVSNCWTEANSPEPPSLFIPRNFVKRLRSRKHSYSKPVWIQLTAGQALTIQHRCQVWYGTMR